MLSPAVLSQVAMYILGGLENRDAFKCVFAVVNSSVCAQ